jgi:hypothetical protein
MSGRDHVDPGLLVVGEHDPAVEYQYLAVLLEGGHVLADMSDSAK